MKKSLMIVTVIALAVLAFSATGQVFAQEATPEAPLGMERGRARGRAIGAARGTGTGIPLEMNINLDGALAEYLHAYMADALGIDPSELVDGNFHEIALGLGYELTEIREIVLQARSEALAQALADGVITQEEFDWLSRARGLMGSAAGMGFENGLRTGDCTGEGPLFDGSSFRGMRQGKGSRGGNQ